VRKRRVHLRAVKHMTERVRSVPLRMQQAADAIQRYAYSCDFDASGTTAQQLRARSNAIAKLSRLSDRDAARVLGANPIHDGDGSFPLASINEVRQRRRQRRAQIVARLKFDMA
jgi:hypothetical protein